MRRRRYIHALCVGSTAVLAGCDGAGGEVPAGDPNGEAQPAGDESTPDDDVGPSGDASSSGSPALADVQMRPATDYRFRIDASGYEESAESVVIEGHWHGGNYHTTVSGDAQGYDTYHVDGTIYYDSGGQCFEVGSTDQQSEVDTQQWADTGETTADLDDWEGLTASGTATIDGERMHVFELTPEDHGVESTYTYYVSAETGYFRRLESEGLVADYWDWGQTEPIEAPC